MAVCAAAVLLMIAYRDLHLADDLVFISYFGGYLSLQAETRTRFTFYLFPIGFWVFF